MTFHRKRARNMLDIAVNCHATGFFGLDDLPDTPMVMNAIDEIEAILKDGDKRGAAKCAIQWSKDILEDEGYLLFD